ncbi:GRAM domain-containing protein [Cohnella herbarum]|uniref:GRAM domain-containing protein n=1 Tax=Cohnella herbarum TaxID=2728023 RepID=A0A7Z2VHE2_9BACL|nr:GRAM domain-containing protein [Cohnella herbarum]QJD83218.1 hypothetical protein HH215_08555 [Cohnella herbarum]
MSQTGNVHFDVVANLFRGIESVGGRIRISDKSVLFTAHAINIQTQITEIAFDQISTITKRNTLGLIPNGMTIETRDGKKYKFVLWNRQKIIDFVSSRIVKN